MLHLSSQPGDETKEANTTEILDEAVSIPN